MNYSEVETKVREATNDDAWGPHGQLMKEISQYTFTYEHFPEVMGMLWKRMLHENKKNWRRVYKVSCYSARTCSFCTGAIYTSKDISAEGGLGAGYWWWWLFPRLWGFGENVQPFISHLQFVSFFEMEISSHTLILLFRPGSVHSGSASWEDCGWVVPDKFWDTQDTTFNVFMVSQDKLHLAVLQRVAEHSSHFTAHHLSSRKSDFWLKSGPDFGLNAADHAQPEPSQA